MVQMEQMRQRLISNWTTTTNETRILSNLIYLGWFFFCSRSAFMKLINILNKYFPYSSNFTEYLWKSVACNFRWAHFKATGNVIVFCAKVDDYGDKPDERQSKMKCEKEKRIHLCARHRFAAVFNVNGIEWEKLRQRMKEKQQQQRPHCE